MYVLVCYVPDSHKEAVKRAMFEAGGGAIGGYACCSWETLGSGQFLPLEGSSPYIGRAGAVERVEEWRVEMVVDEAHVAAVVHAMQRAHPYEVSAYHLIPVMTFDDVPDEIKTFPET
jgi:hypothetical protein